MLQKSSHFQAHCGPPAANRLLTDAAAASCAVVPAHRVCFRMNVKRSNSRGSATFTCIHTAFAIDQTLQQSQISRRKPNVSTQKRKGTYCQTFAFLVMMRMMPVLLFFAIMIVMIMLRLCLHMRKSFEPALQPAHLIQRE
jgi:hypothetical protein